MSAERACELLVLRHGETSWNADGRLQGQQLPGPGLNEQGLRQAAAAAERLRGEPLAAVYSSDLQRAVQTADAVLARLEPPMQLALRHDLRERCLGGMEGLTLHQAAEAHPGQLNALCSGDRDTPIEGGESVAQFEARAVAALNAIADAHPGQRVLVITHGGLLQVVFDLAAGSAGVQGAGRATNCGLSTFVAQPGAGIALMRWDETSHLRGVGSLRGAFGGGSGGA